MESELWKRFCAMLQCICGNCRPLRLLQFFPQRVIAHKIPVANINISRFLDPVPLALIKTGCFILGGHSAMVPVLYEKKPVENNVMKKTAASRRPNGIRSKRAAPFLFSDM